MGEGDRQLVERLYQAFARGDSEEPYRLYAPDIRWDVSESDLADVPLYCGHDGVREFWQRWLGIWRGYRIEAERFLAVGDQVLVDVRFRAVDQSGRERENRHAQVWTVSANRIIRMKFFQDRLAARRALGLPGNDRMAPFDAFVNDSAPDRR